MQTAHVILEVAADDDDDGTRAEEEQRLEHSVGKQVEDTSHVTQTTMVVIYCEANAERYEHVGNLRDSRESQTTLDITLAASYGCCIECGEGCNVSYIVKSLRSILYPDWEEAGYLIYTGYNHGSGVDQRRNRSWTLHRIWQPDVQWEHRTLTGTTDEHEEQRCWHYPSCTCQSRVELWLSIQVIVEGSYVEAVEQDTDEEEEVSETGYDERLLAGMYCSMLWIVETDEQV